MTFLKANKAFTKIFSEYLDYVYVFSANLVIKLLKYNNMNVYVIKFVKNKQPFY